MGELTTDVISWGAPRLRDLPWRRTRDPWAILVSEVMLQQTAAARVIPYWERFMQAFPSPAACADAPLADVLRAWQGLGYPRRARRLQQTACYVAERGSFPDTLDELLPLPGIGPYTARALLAFAFERDVGVVDTNIARLLARVGDCMLTQRQVQRLADSLVPAETSWLWNQAVMDLGAMVCRPVPHCSECPINHHCKWHEAGHPEPDPAHGSAGVSRPQAPYQGSARQARGNLLRALGDGPMRVEAADEAIVESLVADGLITEHEGVLRLAGSA